MGQVECIPQNWADIQESDFYEEWVSAMRLEIEGENYIGTFSADDVVSKEVNAITAVSVYLEETDSDGLSRRLRRCW